MPVEKQARVHVSERAPPRGKVIRAQFLEQMRTSINLLGQGIKPPKQIDPPATIADEDEEPSSSNAPETSRTTSTITLEILDPDDLVTVVGEVDIEQIDTITFNVPTLGSITFQLDNPDVE